ncbi:DUF3943 domain-containing protein [Ferrimonas kyonanensis]|uniref:DUF3943 domain-containing protein n=1 Tax=Ferrimonas kyonanensis TaxID=364763 RepID=UPI000488E888|nr:DUF3943 domain-containing protein [Ferrimonas kyonanensis]
MAGTGCRWLAVAMIGVLWSGLVLAESEELYRPQVTNSSWEQKAVSPSAYDDPYRVSLFDAPHGEDQARLWSQTKSLAWYGVGVAGVIALLPEDISNWDKDNAKPFSKWWDNVSQGPVWDRDNWQINYVGHTYFGGVYYQVARKSGYRQWDAFMYSFLMSTFYWEYGLEAFAEVPSIQDIVVTPVLGWVYGEWAFQTEQAIWAQGGKVWGSQTLGDTALFFLDPVDALGRGINSLFERQVIKAGTGYMTVSEVPMGNSRSDTQVQLGLRYRFGGSSGEAGELSSSRGSASRHAEDPVDFGIVGLGVGMAQLNPDDFWAVESGSVPVVSLGLYFSSRWSTRLSYARTDLNEKGTGKELTYENYSADVQYYFNGDSRLRPFVTAGIGETLRDQDRDKKTFQVNGGLGLHWQLHPNWALQADWRHFHSTRFSTTDDLLATQLIYRFGRGERL